MSILHYIQILANDKPIALVLDLDETIIDTAPFHKQLELNAINLLNQRTNINIFQSRTLVRQYLSETNYVREAFRDNHNIDVETTLHAVYDPSTMDRGLIKDRIDLANAILKTDIPCYLMTNAPSHFSHMSLQEAGLRSLFNQVVATDNIDYLKKDIADAFKAFEAITGISTETHCILFVDNSLGNLQAAHEAGWHGIHTTEFISYKGEYDESVRFPIPDLVSFIEILSGNNLYDQAPSRPHQNKSGTPGISSRF